MSINKKRHRTADTSRAAYQDAKDSGLTHRTRGLVLAALRGYGPMTRHELSAVTGLPLSSICGRVNELMAEGLVSVHEEDGHKVRRDGRYVMRAA